MATATDIATLRRYIGEPDNTTPYTDQELSDLIDDSTSVQAAAAEVWSRKAADSALLVDVSENGSSRKLSDVHRNALAMSRMYRDEAAALVVVTSGRPRTRPIVRP